MSDSKYHQALSANRKLVAEIDRLKAENERLKDAGDALYSIIYEELNGSWLAMIEWEKLTK